MNRKAFLACVLMCVILTGCETAKKISEVIKNPDIQVGSLKEQPSEITVTLLTEPDTNTNAEGESAAVDVQLVYLTDDSKLLAADYDQIASTPLPDVLGKKYIDHQDFNLLPDTIKTLPPVKLDEKTQFIGVVAYFSDDQATEWKQIETVEGTGHHYRLLVAPRQLPYHSGFSYFELDKSGQAWTEMAAAGAVALHVSGSFPDLNMQLWAIRG